MTRRIPGHTETDLKNIVEEYLEKIAIKSSAVTPLFTMEQLDEWLRNRGVATNGLALGHVLTKLVKEDRIKLDCFYRESSHACIQFIYQR